PRCWSGARPSTEYTDPDTGRTRRCRTLAGRTREDPHTDTDEDIGHRRGPARGHREGIDEGWGGMTAPPHTAHPAGSRRPSPDTQQGMRRR
ncbi:hypothetical protein NGM37_48995, partial [Streptomyces sp. TRM76130]|nr:hypothetical protein [Streptomyces sp. TRM76130]